VPVVVPVPVVLSEFNIEDEAGAREKDDTGTRSPAIMKDDAVRSCMIDLI